VASKDFRVTKDPRETLVHVASKDSKVKWVLGVKLDNKERAVHKVNKDFRVSRVLKVKLDLGVKMLCGILLANLI
jgi:hypothetical protein